MWVDNSIYLDDLEKAICRKEIFGHELEGKTILVTGATGLIGLNMVNALLYFGLKSSNPPRVLAMVRNIVKAKQLYKRQLQDCGQNIEFVIGDITSNLQIDEHLDYIVHGASQTASTSFIKNPVETIDIATIGTKNILELAKKKNVKSMVYLSSMEAYGSPTEGILLSESSPAWFDSMSIRSCYPESKRMCEAMCSAYASEYDVPVTVVRLAQTFGPGVSQDDMRVFADFARKALKHEDIVLQTKGDSCRMYLYTMDAVTAILTILLKGEKGTCYNAANKNTYCSIKEMAELVARVLSGNQSKVTLQLNEEDTKKYMPEHKLYLDTKKLEGLGWNPEYGLDEMYLRMVKGF